MKVFDRGYQVFMGTAMRLMPRYRQDLVTGAGSIEKVPWMLRENNCKRPMIVTGPNVCRMDFFKELTAQIPGAVIFTEVEPDPTTEMVEQIMDQFIEAVCDSFVAVGGGSNIDAAKAAAAGLARPDRDIRDLGGLRKVREAIPYFIAVPTTAGTGSECTVAAVVKDSETGRKFSINDPVLCPHAAVLDPDLTASLPKETVAITGMDALTHAVEAYLNRLYHRVRTPRQCLQAVHDIMMYLPFVYEDASSTAARQKLLVASHRAGQAFTTACVGNIHAIAHTLGGLYGIPHGLANAVLLPLVLEDYGRKVQRPLSELAKISGIKGGSREELAAGFIARIREMNAEMGIPQTLDQIREEDLKRMAGWALKEANPLYPVPVIYKQKDVIRILRKAGGLDAGAGPAPEEDESAETEAMEETV